jgi:transposase-like protein
MEKLHIKCPSCGIGLEVKNSKNEAVKRIVCPNCQKQLAVTFREEPKPAQFVEIKMVQLSDGTTKTIVRVLTDEHEIKVNGEILQKDDEVVLASGDNLQVDGKQWVPQQTSPQVSKPAPSPIPSPTPSPVPEPAPRPTPKPTSKSNNRWMIFGAVFAVAILALIVWHKMSNKTEMPLEPEAIQSVITDSMAKAEQMPTTKKSDKPEQRQKEKAKEDAAPKTDLNHLSNYELERMAMSGNAEAQYLIGKRWVNLKDSVNVVKGIKYLKLASQNGSSDARSALRSVYAALQQSAANGSSMAENILREQR